jgi:hypothetical protein
VDRGFDPDAAEPFRGLTAHADRGHAPVDLPGARPGNSPSDHAAAVRTRPWSRHALRALFTAWAAIASSYRADAHMGEAEDRTVHSGSAES